ncbi:MAG TPA: prolyl oligopeptidase family serine peptidase [Thermoanaerobaculia bacterium]|nr:prolyl oligopeptidase family serine peptidase [Thermoanaerobaculia bacterium]
MVRRSLVPTLALFPFLAVAATAAAQENVAFRTPPEEIRKLVDAPLPPSVLVDPAGARLVLLDLPGYKTLAEVAEPELRLAGLRINPKSHNRARLNVTTGISVKEIASGRSARVEGLPAAPRIQWTRFSPKGTYFSFVQCDADGLSLWVVDLASARASRVTPASVSAVLDFPYQWLPDESGLLVHVRPSLEPFTPSAELPAGPVVKVAAGRKAPARTWQDLLKSENDEKTFAHYATTEVRRFALDGTSAAILPPAIRRSVRPSPDGKWILATTIVPPFSYRFPVYRFGYRVDVLDAAGKLAATLVEKPVQDAIPVAFDATEAGRREFDWRDDAPATIVFAEAQDGGDPANDVPFRDRLFLLDAPFDGAPRPFAKTRNRFSEVTWGAGGVAVLSDFRWKDRNTKTYLAMADAGDSEPKVLFDLSSENLYALPGDFVTRVDGRGRPLLLTSRDGKRLFLSGEGYSPEGNRPFLDAYDVATGKTTRLWRADGTSTYERIVRVLDAERGVLLTRVEGSKLFPNYQVRNVKARIAPRPVTSFENPYKPLEAVATRKVRYRRADGIDLAGDLHLPPGYDPKRDGRLPLLLEAYPTEYKDKAAAGMVDSSPHAFVRPYWGSPVFWALRGYAVLENAQFPIVGEGEKEPNDTFVEQLVANAKAAIDALEKEGIVDPKRCAVTGHSYGAFMTANLLAHSDLFAAGIARSGAYNRSLTPFGFQAEERTYWQARDVYSRMSPFDHAATLDEPILLIHGDADNNPGTFTLQSERLFEAIQGLGGRSRLVLLPFESHGYAARENILHMLWETDTWLETWVKGKKD